MEALMIELTCCTCGVVFERKSSEAKRNANLGMRIFCSRQCRGKKIASDTPIEKRVNTVNLPKILDEFSPFRPHLKMAKNHAKKINQFVEITVDDLKRQWEVQKGKCPFTNWDLLNYKSTRDVPVRCPNRASLDRIDCTKGYAKDNIRFVSMMAQFAKNNFSDGDLKHFCESVSQNLGRTFDNACSGR